MSPLAVAPTNCASALPTDDDLREAAAQLQRQGAVNVLISLGGEVRSLSMMADIIRKA